MLLRAGEEKEGLSPEPSVRRKYLEVEPRRVGASGDTNYAGWEWSPQTGVKATGSVVAEDRKTQPIKERIEMAQ